jgi:hypothetical protein
MLDQKSFPNRPLYCGHLIPWTLGAACQLSPGLWARPVSYPLDSGRGRESQIWTLGAIPWTLGAIPWTLGAIPWTLGTLTKI